MKKRIKGFLLALIIMFTMLPIGVVNGTSTNTALQTIYQYFDHLKNQDYQAIQCLLAYEDRPEYAAFIASEDNANGHIGYFNYTDLEVISCTLLDGEESYDSHISENKRDNYTNWLCWDCIVDVTPYQESRYLADGYNRFIIYTAEDSEGNTLIVEKMRLSNYTQSASEDTVSTLGLPWDEPISASYVGEWELPKEIIVALGDKLLGANGYYFYYKGTTTVEFKQYCYVVTANEFGTSSDSQEARKAAAMCVKQYAWNRIIVQKYEGYGYDIRCTTDDQVYDTSKTVTINVQASVIDTWDYMMLTNDLRMFCSFFADTSASNANAVYHGGALSHQEANSLGKNGYTWQEILHYFYDYGTFNGVAMNGPISIILIDHTPTGTRTAILGNLYNHSVTCTTCGCTHTETHTWIYSSSTYRCKQCGITTTTPPSIITSIEEDDYA